nr:MAG TPA: hypothetical protein [Caudoviricetes sp.]
MLSVALEKVKEKQDLKDNGKRIDCSLETPPLKYPHCIKNPSGNL